MSRRKKPTVTIQVKPLKRRTGHYSFQGDKCAIDSRPNRERTRADQNKRAIDDHS